MTDQQKLEALFNELGIGYSIHLGPDTTEIVCQPHMASKVVGYTDFAVEFIFDNDGKFKHLGVWES